MALPVAQARDSRAALNSSINVSLPPSHPAPPRTAFSRGFGEMSCRNGEAEKALVDFEPPIERWRGTDPSDVLR